MSMHIALKDMCIVVLAVYLHVYDGDNDDDHHHHHVGENVGHSLL